MHNGQTISLKNILWKVMRHPLATDLLYDDAAMYAIEAIKLLGTPLSYVSKVTDPPLTVKNYKAKLPKGLINVRGIKLINGPYPNDGGLALTHATNIYHTENDCDIANFNPQEFTYIIESGIIKTSFEEGDIVVSYKSLPIDDDGYPLISDDAKTPLAMEYYILSRHLEPLYDIGKITDKAFQRIDQKRHWYMGAAQSANQLQGMDHLEAMMNSLNRLLILDQTHENFYRLMGKKEHLKRYY